MTSLLVKAVLQYLKTRSLTAAKANVKCLERIAVEK